MSQEGCTHNVVVANGYYNKGQVLTLPYITRLSLIVVYWLDIAETNVTKLVFQMT